MLTTFQWILLITIINGFLAFAGALFFSLIKKDFHKSLIYFVSFTTGALLGGAFLHFLPEAAEELSLVKTTLLTLSGFIIFFFLETYLHWHHCSHGHHCDKHKDEKKPFVYLLLYGDAIHNFIDGIIIASSFIISIPLGIITSLLIIAHELPQEISDFAVLIYGGFSKRKALLYNFLSQLTAVLGGLIGYFFIGIKEQAIFLLPIAAGGFLHIAISDLIPEIFKEKDPLKRIINMLIIVAGILILLSAKTFAE
tara:strand:- start:562 stop:1320 length:759 start_codon:yes stop_codon:yes gene_type:complete